jgi:hypothetical protein
MSDEVFTGEAARRLGTTRPTVRSMLVRGDLSGRKERHGSRDYWLVRSTGIDRYLDLHGKVDDRRKRAAGGRRDDVEFTAEGGPARSWASELDRLGRERDDLRARVVELQDALARTRTAAELQARADVERSVVLEHLLAAAQAGERADELRRQALAELHEAVGVVTRPGHPGQLRES